MDKGKPLYVTEIIRVLGKRRTTLNSGTGSAPLVLHSRNQLQPQPVSRNASSLRVPPQIIPTGTLAKSAGQHSTLPLRLPPHRSGKELQPSCNAAATK
ncbi:uncharacterized protein O9250_002895 isoform 3-T11 [Rhynochetos jubatus]